MATSYTTLLGMALPVTGELQGTWGTTVNSYITEYVDSAVAGTQTISGSQTAVTLSKTTGASLTQAGSGATGSSQFAIINCTGNPAGLLTITAPAASQSYLVINGTSTSQSVKIVGAGPTTGVTLISGEKALVAWNGSDFIKVATTAAAGGSNTQVQYNNNGVLAGSAGLTWDGTTLVASNLTDSSLTSGRVVYATTSGNLTDSANLLFDGTTLTANALTTTSTVTINGGTANGVGYLNASKQFTTGSVLTFDGTNLGVGIASPANRLVVSNSGASGFEFVPASNQILSYNRTASNYEAFNLIGSSIGFYAGNVPAAIAFVSTPGIGVGDTAINLTGYGKAVLISDNAGGTLILKDADATSGQRNKFLASVNGELRFGTANDGGSGPAVQATLDSSGNLGLGVTPSAWGLSGLSALQIKNASFFGYVNNAYMSANEYNDSAGTARYIASAAATRYVQSAGTHAWNTAASGTAGNAITFTQAMTLNASGNLGVGTSSPSGNGRLELDVPSGNNTNLTFYENGSSRWLIGSVTSSNAFRFYDLANATERARIDSSGNFGIGTSSPSYKLDVDKGSAGIVAKFKGGTRSAYVYSDNDAVYFASDTSVATAFGCNETSDYLTFFTGNAERMRLDSSGNLGLGVTPTGAMSRLASLANSYGAFAAIANGAGTGDGTLTTSAMRVLNNAGTTWQIGRYEAYAHVWGVGGAASASSAMTLDASGNLLVGLTSGTGKFELASGSGSSVIALRIRSLSTNSNGFQIVTDSTTDNIYLNNYYSAAMLFGTNNTERARITSGGDLLVGTTTNTNSARIKLSWATGNYGIESVASADTLSYHVVFQNASYTPGNISTTNNATTYATTSDYRLKKNIQPMTNALAKVQQLKPCTYTWKADGSDGEGFIAHELQAVIPDAVVGQKDEVDADGKPRYQSIDTSFLVATLTAAIQEQQAMINELKAEVAALKAK